MFDAALRTAQELDQYFKDHGTVKGPLHGLPVSLKDQFHVKGYDTTMGYVGWIDTMRETGTLPKCTMSTVRLSKSCSRWGQYSTAK